MEWQNNLVTIKFLHAFYNEQESKTKFKTNKIELLQLIFCCVAKMIWEEQSQPQNKPLKTFSYQNLWVIFIKRIKVCNSFVCSIPCIQLYTSYITLKR